MSASEAAPSPRRREEARRRGAVPTSRLLPSSAALLCATAALISTAPATAQRLLLLARRAFSDGAALAEPAAAASAGASATALLPAAFSTFLVAVLPAAAAACVAALGVGLLQTGGLFTLTPLLPGERDTGAPLPAEPRPGFAFRLAVLAAAALSTVSALRREWPARAALDAEHRGLAGLVARVSDGITGEQTSAELLRSALELSARVALRVAVTLLAVGLVDLAFRRWLFERALRTSRAEADRERREDEGDPRLRAERRRRHRAGESGPARPSGSSGGGDGGSAATR